jgi:hypothetical protein
MFGKLAAVMVFPVSVYDEGSRLALGNTCAPQNIQLRF